MRKTTLLLILSAMLFEITGCAVKASSIDPKEIYGTDTLNVFNWGEYISYDVIDSFEREFNVKVNYSTYDSCEMLYTKLKANSATYDVIVPADYMIERLIKEDMLQPLDYSFINETADLDENALNLLKEIDPELTYTLPYFISTAGIVYNRNTVSLKDLEKEGWAIFKDERYIDDVYMYDSERDAFMIALKDLGYSANTSDPKELEEAFNWLKELHETTKPDYVTDEVIDSMANEMKSLALVYSGDAAYITSVNSNMDYYIPKSGSRIEVDGFAIPKNSENVKLASEFINYMLKYENALDNSVTVGYTSSDSRVINELTTDGDIFEGNKAYLFDMNQKNSELFHDSEQLKRTLSDLWIRVKLG